MGDLEEDRRKIFEGDPANRKLFEDLKRNK